MSAPSPRELFEYYQEKSTKVDELRATYENPNWYKRWFYRNRSRAVLEALAPSSGDFVLDVGAGPGHYGRILRASGAQVASLDIARPYLEQASHPVRGWAVMGDAATLPFLDSSFSKVLATEVVEHTPRPERVIGEIARVLRPDGRAVVTAPSRTSYMNRMYELKRRVHRYAFNEHISEMDQKAFRSLLEQHLTVTGISFANCLVPFPLDYISLRMPPSFERALTALERSLRSGRGGPVLGWTMIAACEKPRPPG